MRKTPSRGAGWLAAPAVRPESAALTVSGSYRIDQRIQGAAAFAPGQTVTGSLPASLESFRATHGTLEEAAEAFREARRVCDAALAESAAAATLPDLGLDGLASKQVGARLESRKNPFSSSSSHSPSALSAPSCA